MKEYGKIKCQNCGGETRFTIWNKRFCGDSCRQANHMNTNLEAKEKKSIRNKIWWGLHPHYKRDRNNKLKEL